MFYRLFFEIEIQWKLENLLFLFPINHVFSLCWFHQPLPISIIVFVFELHSLLEQHRSCHFKLRCAKLVPFIFWKNTFSKSFEEKISQCFQWRTTIGTKKVSFFICYGIYTIGNMRIENSKIVSKLKSLLYKTQCFPNLLCTSFIFTLEEVFPIKKCHETYKTCCLSCSSSAHLFNDFSINRL